MRTLLLLVLTALVFSGCASLDKELGPPDRFQNIKLGMTFNELSRSTETEQIEPTILRINSPTDKIERIDCYFTKDLEHLYELEITHFMREGFKFDTFIQDQGRRHGQYDSRMQEEREDFDHPVSVVVWQNRHVKYTVEGRRYGAASEKLVIVEFIRDVGYLAKRQQEEVNDQYRSKRRLIESGKF